MSTITPEEQSKISAYLSTHVIPQGLGTEESACSIAAINLALSGRLTDQVPDCMSHVIGRWIIRVQDAMPHEMRNSDKWKALLPLAAGTGRNPDDEKRRVNLILGWMWDTVLPYLQPIADERGFGSEWHVMTSEKTSGFAKKARKAADSTLSYIAMNAVYAINDFYRSRYDMASDAAANCAARTVSVISNIANTNAMQYAVSGAASHDIYVEGWNHFDPISLLEKLIDA